MKKGSTSHHFTVPKEVEIAVKTLENAGFEAYLVGGCVRDLVRGVKPKDWDLTTNATPEQIIASFQKTFYENSYGTVGVVNEFASDETLKIVEITPYRLETTYTNNRHPDAVIFSPKIEDDLKRRDFTVNALAMKLEKKDMQGYSTILIDNFDGQSDLSKKLIRTVGKPDDRFREDALRILRAIRLCAEMNFALEQETAEAIVTHAHLLENISSERIRDEFSRILLSPNPLNGLILSQKLGVLKIILPEIEEALGIAQNQAHAFDVFEHLLRTVQHAADKGWPLHVRLAALFHDIGKPASRRWSEEKKDWTFYGHDVTGAKMTAKILARLKFPKETIGAVVKLVRWHMFFSDTELITLSSVRRLVKNVGTELIWDLMNVRACDRIGTGRPKESPYRLRKYKAMVEEVMHDPISVSMLKINGGRIMEIGHIEPGPKIGLVLHVLLEDVLDEPSNNTPEYLEKKAVELLKMPENELVKIGKDAKEKKEEEEARSIKEIRDKYWVK